MKADDGFPKAEFSALLRRLPGYVRLAWALAGERRLSRTRRAALLAAAAYVASPIDLVPGIIPVLGQLDDMAIALGAIKLALAGLPADVRTARLAESGLTQSDIDADIRATGAIAGWLARSGVRVSRQVARAAMHGAAYAWRGARSVARRTSRK